MIVKVSNKTCDYLKTGFEADLSDLEASYRTDKVLFNCIKDNVDEGFPADIELVSAVVDTYIMCDLPETFHRCGARTDVTEHGIYGSENYFQIHTCPGCGYVYKLII